VTAEYRGGPAHGKVEHFVPAAGEAVERRYHAIPPTVGLPVIEDATADFRGPQVAEYVLVYGSFIDLNVRDAFLRDVDAGTYLVFGIYEYRRTT
jgi:hypothetical protein